MRETAALLRHEKRARVFFLALAQSALGTGASYVALLLIAYDRFESPWAISFVLIADVVPAMLLGPVFGAVADRWSRKGCAVLADAISVVAFVGIALVDGYVPTVGFALLAGVGTGLFRPSTLAALPSVVDDRARVPAATSLYGAVADFGFTAGPAVAAGVLALGGPETLVLINAATFAISGLLLVPLRFGDAPERSPDAPAASVFGEAREGLRALARTRAIRVVLMASSTALFGAGLFNIAELLFATEEIGTTQTGFAALVACFGVGFISGSLAGSKGGRAAVLKRRYLLSLPLFGGGFVAMSFAPAFAVALATFVVAGFGNGLMLVHERLLIQETVDDSLVGRIFGAEDALSAWAFGTAFLAGGALLEVLSVRELILGAGGVVLVAYVAVLFALRDEWPEEPPASGEQRLDGRADVRGDGRVLGQQGTDVVRGA